MKDYTVVFRDKETRGLREIAIEAYDSEEAIYQAKRLLIPAWRFRLVRVLEHTRYGLQRVI
jgi:hypothetical protein